MVGALKLGKHGLDELGDAAQKLGLVMSNVDAAKALAADKAIGSLSKSLKGLGNILAVTVAPIVEVVGDGLDTLVESIKAVASNFGFCGSEASDFSKQLDEASAFSRQARKSAANVTEMLGKGGTSIVTGIADAIKEVNEQLKEAAKAHEKLEEAGKRMTESVRTPFETYHESLATVNDLLAENVISLETFQRASLKAFEAYDKATEMKKTMDRQQSVGAVTQNSVAGFRLSIKATETRSRNWKSPKSRPAPSPAGEVPGRDAAAPARLSTSRSSVYEQRAAGSYQADRRRTDHLGQHQKRVGKRAIAVGIPPRT